MIGAIVYFHSGTSSLCHCKPVTARVCTGAGLQTTLREACVYTTSNAGLTGMRAATIMVILPWSLSRVLTRCQMLEILKHFTWIVSLKVLRTLWGFTLLFPFFKGGPFSLQRFSWLTQRLAAEQGYSRRSKSGGLFSASPTEGTVQAHPHPMLSPAYTSELGLVSQHCGPKKYVRQGGLEEIPHNS